MATHDYVIANGTGAAVRSDLNNALAAIVSNNSSSTEPGTTYAYQWWADTNANVLKLRNSANDGWITVRELDGTMLIEDGSASTPGLAFASDLDTGLFRSADNRLNFATGGTERLELGSSEAVFNDPSDDYDFRVESNNSTHMLFVDAGNDAVGIKTSTPGDLNGNANDLVVGSGTGHNGMSIYAGSSSNSNIYFADGTSGADEYAGYIQFSHSSDTMKFGIQGNDAVYIDSDKRLLVGTSSDTTGDTGAKVQIVDSGTPVLALSRNDTSIFSNNTIGQIRIFSNDDSGYQECARIAAQADGDFGNDDKPTRLVFSTTSDGGSSPTERLRINSEGKTQVTGTRAGTLQASDNDSLELFTSASNGNANTGCGLTFYNNDGNGSEMGGTIQVAKENGSINNTAGYMRFCTRPNASDVAERMRIGSGGDVLISRTSASISTVGHYFLSVGAASHTRNADVVMEINRLSNDGGLINFRQGDTLEGSIDVSGSTVSYNGGHLSRWSQLASGAARTEILRGSVLSNLDEMCEWAYEARDAVLYTEEDELPEGVSVGDVKTPARDAGTENNEQLNRMKVSDVEGDVNVSGVFQAWDDDDDTYDNDFTCAMTGDFVIRIAQGTTVARGDLLMSAGDGTAKPQDDDIVRSKTIAKVTSTTVSTTYSDGSYCVPCVLMAC